jgi:hypothetical protein
LFVDRDGPLPNVLIVRLMILENHNQFKPFKARLPIPYYLMKIRKGPLAFSSDDRFIWNTQMTLRATYD